MQTGLLAPLDPGQKDYSLELNWDGNEAAAMIGVGTKHVNEMLAPSKKEIDKLEAL